MIVVEAAFRPETWQPLLKRAAYVDGGFDSCNLYFVREEESARAAVFRLPPNVGDRYISWSQVEADQASRKWTARAPAVVKRILTRMLGFPTDSWRT